MDLGTIEETLRDRNASAILMDPRLLRRVIKRHRRLPGLGLDVPHARCYVLRRDALLAIVEPSELGRDAESLPAEIILLPRPTPDDLAGAEPADVLGLLFRSTFHARVHLEIERRIQRAALTKAMIRERIHRIGETEFDEIRRVLRSDELLLPPYDDLETYAEFAALYLELRHFAPALVERHFPTLSDLDRVDAALAVDIDAPRLLEESRLEGAAETSDGAADDLSALLLGRSMAAATPSSPPQALADARRRLPARVARPLATRARARGNAVRSALLRLGLGDEASRVGARADLDALTARLCRALDVPKEPAWTPLFLALAQRAGPRRGLRHTVEARLLYDLQGAAVARERTQRAVDVIEWALSFGRRPVVRSLPATTPVRIARFVRAAAKKAALVRIAAEDRARLAELLRDARERADHNLRSALRPSIVRVLREIRLVPANAPERVALAKLTEELLDHVEAHGFFGIGHLRDALSKNQLKLADLSGPLELVRGDALLRADRRLRVALDGVYRGGEIYLRVLQKLSSIVFGTRLGRFLTLYLILPFGAAFVLLEGVGHIVSPIAHLFGHHGHIKLFHLTTSFPITGVLLFCLLHSTKIRAFAMQVLSSIAFVIALIFYRFPRFLLGLPVVRRIAGSRPVRLLARWGLKPAALTAAIEMVPPLRRQAPDLRLGVGIALFVAFNVALNSRLGILAEELLVDWLVRKWRVVSRRILPGLFQLVAEFFRRLLEAFERGIYRVDEMLRFRDGDGAISLVVKAALGTLWAFISYLARIYINLLIEPQVNPLKHFPVVTVSHKLMIPIFGQMTSILETPFLPLGKVPASAIAGATALLSPGVFGFLVWEFKENWKLYRATRPDDLRPALIGHHGETMGALMKPGFHSGTLPKLYTRLRRAARNNKDAALARHKEALHEVEEAVSRFIARELISLLAEAPRFRSGPVEVTRARLGSNRVRIELGCAGFSEEPCWIDFEEQSGFLVASLPRAGFCARLPPVERQIFENALAGLYQLAGVDLVREQVEASICRAFGVAVAPPYDISAEGLVVWPAKAAAEEAYRTEVVYGLDGAAKPAPIVRGEPLPEAPPHLDREAILCRRQPIRWVDWVRAWDAAQRGEAPIPRVPRGASLLPAEPAEPGER